MENLHVKLGFAYVNHVLSGLNMHQSKLERRNNKDLRRPQNQARSPEEHDISPKHKDSRIAACELKNLWYTMRFEFESEQKHGDQASAGYI